ncbi:MAG: AI-2E family transporter, partial [Bacillota bacterium]
TKIGLQEPPNVERLLEGLGNFLVGSGGQQLFSRGADVLFGLVVALAFTLAGSLFLLSEDPHTFLRPGLRLLDPRHRPAMQAVLTDLGPRFRRWVIGTLTGMFVVFSASAVGFWSIGLKFAVPLALLAGFAEVVPTVGPAVACVFLVLFAAAVQSGAKALAVLIVYGIIEALEAYIILPLIMRGAVNVPPAVTLFTVVLWGKIFGVPGLILAIPINLTIWSLLVQFRVRPREAEQMPLPLQSAKVD